MLANNLTGCAPPLSESLMRSCQSPRLPPEKLSYPACQRFSVRTFRRCWLSEINHRSRSRNRVGVVLLDHSKRATLPWICCGGTLHNDDSSSNRRARSSNSDWQDRVSLGNSRRGALRLRPLPRFLFQRATALDRKFAQKRFAPAILPPVQLLRDHGRDLARRMPCH